MLLYANVIVYDVLSAYYDMTNLNQTNVTILIENTTEYK